MRQIWQVEYCKNLHNTTFVWIESDTRLRYRRLIKNKKFSWDYESFLNIEKLDEWSIQNVWKCLEYCDIMIENNWSPEEFERSLSVLTK
jgi:hypothetical protein